MVRTNQFGTVKDCGVSIMVWRVFFCHELDSLIKQNQLLTGNAMFICKYHFCSQLYGNPF